MNYDMNEFSNDVDAFNYLKGWNENADYSPTVMPQLIEGQLLRIQEELKETFQAHSEKDDIEILDGAVDILVTAVGLVQLLSRTGTDVGGAMQEVAQNNLMKFTDVQSEAEETRDHYKTKGEDCEVHTVYTDEGGSIYAVLRNSDNKLLKPINHPRVELSKYLPRPDDISVP